MKFIALFLLLAFSVSAKAQSLDDSIKWTKAKLEKYSVYGNPDHSLTIERTKTSYIIRFVQLNYKNNVVVSKLVSTVNLRTLSQSVNLFDSEVNDDIVLTLSTADNAKTIKKEYTSFDPVSEEKDFSKPTSQIILLIPKAYKNTDNIINRIKDSIEHIIKVGGGKKELF